MLTRLAMGVLVLTTAVWIAGCGAPGNGTGGTATETSEPPPEQPPEPEMTDTDPPEQPRETLPADTASLSTPADPDGTPLTAPAEAAPAEETDAPESVATLTAGPVSLLMLPWEEIQQHITDNLAGKIVVVDFWATYCAPCRESFPGLVELSQQDPENIVCLSVSLDDPDDEDKQNEALEFLQAQNATFTNVLCTTDADTLYDEILEIGGIPAVFVYGRDGELAKKFTGPTEEGTDHTYGEHITPYVTELAAGEAANK